jgi:hypothetical protein
MVVGSDGELEEEVDMDRIITDQDREQAAELKVKANKAFACKSPLHRLMGFREGSWEYGQNWRTGRSSVMEVHLLTPHFIPSEAVLTNQQKSSINLSTFTRKLSP